MQRSPLVVLALSGGCFVFAPAHNLHGGETLYVAEDSPVSQVMGTQTHKVDPRVFGLGRLTPVLATGAAVRVAADYEEQRKRSAPDAPLANRNPWILVEVVDSPIAGQRGWKGWIHVGTTRNARVAPREPGVGLSRASHVCPLLDANEAMCNVTLAANSVVRVIGCHGPRVELESFTEEGLYVHGFVSASQFPSAPCTTAAQEVQP